MKKVSLLAGSLSLLGLTTAVMPVSAEVEPSVVPVANAAASLLESANSSPELGDAAIEQPLLVSDRSVSDVLFEVGQDSLVDEEDPTLGQVTDVNQLTDVLPTDWAFQALQSLIQRWGCIAGYPDGTFRGQQSATRFELAAALNACLDSAADKFATKEELEVVKRLQEEFAAELAVLKGRVDQLEARTDVLEEQQFSTTTKLQGQVVMAGQFGDFVNSNPANLAPIPGVGAGDLGAPGLPGLTANGSSNATAIARVRLFFNTSFTGNDLLETTLETGNGGSDFLGTVIGGGNPAPLPGAFIGNNVDSAGDAVPFADLGPVDYTGSGPDVTLYRLAYTFKPTENLTFTFGPIIFPSDFIDGNSYANDEATDFSSSFFINNPLIIGEPIDGPGGAGGALDWNVGGGPFSVRALYIAGNGFNATDPATDICAGGFLIAGGGCGGGLGGDPGQASIELEYADDFGPQDKNNFAVRLQYTRSQLFNVSQNVVGANVEATFGRFGIFGRYGISIDPQLDTLGGAEVDLFGAVPGVGSNNIQTWQAGFGVRDLIIPGSLLAASVGQPFLVDTVETVAGQPTFFATQTNAELFFRFPINDNISLTPAVMYISNPLNVDVPGVNTDIVQGLIRATFQF